MQKFRTVLLIKRDSNSTIGVQLIIKQNLNTNFHNNDTFCHFTDFQLQLRNLIQLIFAALNHDKAVVYDIIRKVTNR